MRHELKSNANYAITLKGKKMQIKKNKQNWQEIREKWK